MRVAFVDCETTGLDPDRHDPWEIAVILPQDDGPDTEIVYVVKPDLTAADPTALRICRYYERSPRDGIWDDPYESAKYLAWHLDRRHIVGAVPSFDAAFLARFLTDHGQQPTWHYHLIDVETLAVGYLTCRDERPVGLPWDSDELSKRLGIVPDEKTRHTALGDARWARDMYRMVVG